VSPALNISNVWMTVNADLQREIVDFWHVNQMLGPHVNAGERAAQVILTVRSDKKIVGLTSADFVRFRQLNDNLFYLFRMAVLPSFRVPGIESRLIVESRDILEKFAASRATDQAIGMLTFVENPKLIAHRNEAVWPASRMVYIGSDKKGRHIRVYYFKGARI
jgi:hypothetical protein